MRFRYVAVLSTLAALFVLVLPGLAAPPSTAKVGEKIANVSFTDASGKTFALHDFKGKKALVLAFLSFECPVSKSYAQPLAELDKEFGKHGVVFLGLTVLEEQTPAEIARLAREYNIPFPVVLDRQLRAADAVKAEVTPEVFVLDGDFVLRYRGRIDDGYIERLKKHPAPTKYDLRQALGEILSGRPVREPATIAIGCPIQRPEHAHARGGSVTFYRDVLPLLQNNCQSCHRPGEVGPFSLMNYRQAVNWADDIKSYTAKRLMPPWKPTGGPAFHSERKMSDKDIGILAAWVDGGTPAGDPKDAPPARQFPQGWQLGTPDLVLTVPEEFTLGPTGRDLFRCFVLPTNVTEDKFVTAVEVRPSNPRVVHHTLQFVDSAGEGRKLERLARDKKTAAADDAHAKNGDQDKGPGYTVSMGVGFLPKGGLSGWAPGQMPRFLPDGTGYFLPKNSDIVVQVHFHRNGRLEKERTQIGLYFAKKPVAKVYQGGILPGGSGKQGLLRLFFSIPPGESHFRLGGDLWATGDLTLYSIMPHMHLLGKSIKVTMTPPAGEETTLVNVKDWEYNWQETYWFKEPVRVKAGTRFHVDAVYDNSSNNPNNPFNPPRRITYGEQTTNEMCFVFLGGISPNSGRKLPLGIVPPKAKKAQTYQIPYRLTDTLHVLVRAKINGQGPFNFIVDTGAPMLVVSTPVGKKLGLGADDSGWTTLDRFELEGGAVQNKIKCRVETPFQLEGMNGLGLAGAELHGMIGYTVLARYRMEFDFTRDKMAWTELDFAPPLPRGIRGADSGMGGLEILGSVMKFLGVLAGKNDIQVLPRGFLGIELAESDGGVAVAAVLNETPAAAAGMKKGDRIEKIAGRAVATIAEAQRLTARVTAGQQVRFTIRRGAQKQDITVTAGEGL